ncbi:MAG TPA: hypothetical protein VGG74_09085 [Kofleriaceae bacterium]|jgi:hypothetical protein
MKPSLTASARQHIEQLRDLEPWAPGARAALWSRIEASAYASSTTGSRLRWVAVAAAVGLAVFVLGSRHRAEVAGPRIAGIPSSTHLDRAAAAPSPSPVVPPARTHRITAAAPVTIHEHVPAKPRARVTGSAPRVVASADEAVPLPITRAEVELAPTFEQCGTLATPVAQQTCYAAIAAGVGPAAANALYALALLDRDVLHDRADAVRTLHDYQRRFPDGPLAPEVALAVIAELRHDRCARSAVDEIDRFLRRYPGDSRAASLERLRARLGRGPATGR